MLSILLLGAPLISVNGQPLDTLRRKNRALVYCLARHVAPLTRDEALAFLWPDHPRPAAQHSLRTTLSELRHQLGPALLVEAESLALAPETQVDTRRFEAGIAAAGSDLAALSKTLELYRGDFLQGFSLADPPEFDDWVTEQREHFRALAVRGLAALAHLHEQQRDHVAALEALNHALAFDPLQEDLQRAALRLHYRLGDRAAAIRRYEALRRQLDEELGVPPSPETRAVYAALITDSPTLLAEAVPELNRDSPAHMLHRAIVHAVAAPLLPFTGRAQELHRIQEAAEQAQLICGRAKCSRGIEVRHSQRHAGDDRAGWVGHDALDDAAVQLRRKACWEGEKKHQAESEREVSSQTHNPLLSAVNASREP